jgi:hypothetical protein
MFPIASMLHSSCAVVLGHELYGDKCPKIINWLHTVFCKISEAKNWVLYRVNAKRMCHVIHTGLEPGYYDEDLLILHGCMAMLCRYIEWHGTEGDMERFNAELRDPTHDPSAPMDVKVRQADRQAEALAIYRWWKYEKPAEEKRRDELRHELYGRHSSTPRGDKVVIEKYRALENKIDDDEQKMLHRLIDIRPSLWT